MNQHNMSTLVIGKGDKQREVYFSIRDMYHLYKYLKQREDDCTALMITERKPYRMLSRRGIQREIGIIAKKAGLKTKLALMFLTHVCNLTLNNGAELVAIQELLGHSSPDDHT
nr:tyrosine-type recombinase/integrase [Neobacillus sp. 114]